MNRDRPPSGDSDIASRQIPIAVSVNPAAQTTPTQCTDAESYALRVIGDDFAPQLPDGCVVIIDPGVAPRSGQYVVAEINDGISLGVAVERAGDWVFHPRGIDREGVVLQAAQIRGVVVQRAGRRRRDHLRLA
jgi:SOS-response transcriptional repressor LexA